ncbi:hypothetical protein GCM10009810_32020 [Nostocoides vanveenii]|uniref:GIY-YIG domain-containing protein n=1 Tax=Nostocoides vanveenii TaxID=330835 RepID=A0ABN2L1U3_9MICO
MRRLAPAHPVTLPHVTDELADWSAWAPLLKAVADAPTVPGVYMARERHSGQVVYVGMAGERSGRGLRGRLRVYLSGKAAVSGLGEAAMDRALADADGLANMLAEVREGSPGRTRVWATRALTRAELEIRWATCADKTAAVALERQAIATLADTGLWNRAQ